MKVVTHPQHIPELIVRSPEEQVCLVSMRKLRDAVIARDGPWQ